MMTTTALRMVLLGACASALHAQATTTTKPPLFTRGDALWSAAFLAGSIALSTADVRIARSFSDTTRQTSFTRNFSKIQEGSLTLGNVALWGIGRLIRAPGLADVGFHAAESVVLASVASQIIRGPLGRSRPYDSGFSNQYDFHAFQGFGNFKYRAFPSIHSASAFAVATVYTMEAQRRSNAGWIVGPIAYALAAGPGLARMKTGQHWASDVLSGAFLGTLAGAKVVKYNHDVSPNNRINRFFLGPQNLQAAATANGLSLWLHRTF